MSKDMKWIKNFFLIIFVTIVSFEILSFTATKFDLFLVNETPTVYKSRTIGDFQDIAYGRTEKDKWGAWHANNLTIRHSKSCFDITMTFNEVGARDNSFANLPTTSLILLGDSFAEGYGVTKNKTSEQLIEKSLGVPVLNFGASGNFGPLQELLIYEDFKHLPHQGLIVYILPDNDFTDNDLEVWTNINQIRYRPYFSESGDPLIPYYFPTAVPRDNFLDTSYGSIKQIIKEYFWSANALRTILKLIRGNAKIFINKKNNYPIGSYFYDASDKQQSNLILAYEAILRAADNKNVLFVIIPRINDISRWKDESDKDGYQESYWYKSFVNFQNRTEQRVELLNLIEYLPSQTKELFFECDGHWSPKGNRWAADIISHFIKDKNLFKIER